MKRILGSIGNAGVSILILPQNPILREPDPTSWDLMGIDSFNGRPENAFKQTTLRLSFSESNAPIFDENGGVQDSQISLLESVVSIHDCGQWIGDIDILKSVQSHTYHRLLPQIRCGHEANAIPARKFASLESWDEILEPPKESSVIRANGNWTARLATTTVLVHSIVNSHNPEHQEEPRTVVCPDSVCWQCLDAEDNCAPPKRPFYYYIF